MSHWSIDLASAVLVTLCLLVLVVAVGFATRRLAKPLRAVITALAGLALFANPATEAVWLLPVSARRTSEMLDLAQREHLVGQPS